MTSAPKRSCPKRPDLPPGEPAGWGNWGVLALRQRNFDAATQRFERARELAPKDAAYLQPARYAGEQPRPAGRGDRALPQGGGARSQRPADPVCARTGDRAARGSRTATSSFSGWSRGSWPRSPTTSRRCSSSAVSPRSASDAAALRSAARATGGGLVGMGAGSEGAARGVAGGRRRRGFPRRRHAATLLRNVLLRVPELSAELAWRSRRLRAKRCSPSRVSCAWSRRASGRRRPIWRSRSTRGLADGGEGRWNWVGARPTDRRRRAGDRGRERRRGATVHRPQAALSRRSARTVRPSPEGVVALDFDYDFKTDLVLAGAGGVRLFRQEGSGAFVDVTAAKRIAEDGRRRALHRRLGGGHRSRRRPRHRARRATTGDAGGAAATTATARSPRSAPLPASRACASSSGSISTATAIPTLR